MALYIVSTPIGHTDDISQRALDTIRNSEMIIGEERKVTSKFLKLYGLTGRPIELLNEHSEKEDLAFLFEQCKSKEVALISDCGTPGFCDPGADLVSLCRKGNVPVKPVPGASSLMAFLAVTGYRLDHFLFRGFLSGNTEQRSKDWRALKSQTIPFIIMDTPYRLGKTLGELNEHFSACSCVVGYKLTQEEELVAEGSPSQLVEQFEGLKGEFILLVLPPNKSKG